MADTIDIRSLKDRGGKTYRARSAQIFYTGSFSRKKGPTLPSQWFRSKKRSKPESEEEKGATTGF